MGIFGRIQGELEDREKHEGGITPADLLSLSVPLRQLMRRITREGELTVEAAAQQLGESPDNTRQMLDTLCEKGFLQREERDTGWVYSIHFADKRGRNLPVGIWSALGQRTKDK
jgi:predicted ArsR family transcriptional regulator